VPAPDRTFDVTSQGHPTVVFQRAIERGNVVAAELAARQLGGLSLVDALELTALIALRDRGRAGRAGARWLQRWLDETAGATIEDACMVAGCLSAFGGRGHQHALEALRAIVKR
jgi:hypothetical protein